jgi:hypothetical protein
MRSDVRGAPWPVTKRSISSAKVRPLEVRRRGAVCFIA